MMMKTCTPAALHKHPCLSSSPSRHFHRISLFPEPLRRASRPPEPIQLHTLSVSLSLWPLEAPGRPSWGDHHLLSEAALEVLGADAVRLWRRIGRRIGRRCGFSSCTTATGLAQQPAQPPQALLSAGFRPFLLLVPHPTGHFLSRYPLKGSRGGFLGDWWPLNWGAGGELEVERSDMSFIGRLIFLSHYKE